MAPVRERLTGIGRVFGGAAGNNLLRRLVAGYVLFFGAELAVWLALLVYAYQHGGAAAGSLMALVQLIPSALLAPLIGTAADRRRPGRILLTGYLLQAASIGAVAIAIASGGPAWLPFALAPLANLAITVTRPAQAALLPAVVHTPEELTAANVLGGWSEGAGGLVAPAVAGVLMGVSGTALAVGFAAALSLTAAVLVLPVAGPPPAGRAGPVTAQLRASLRAAVSHPSARVLLTLHAYYFAVVGAVDLLCVILALGVLHLGESGVGYLNAALGAGIVLAASVTALMVGRPRLAGTMLGGLLGAGLALAVLGVRPSVVGAYLLIGAVGFGGSVFDVTARTLLQRTVPADCLAGVFSVLESLMNVGLAAGIVIVRVAEALGGYRAALIAPAVIGLVLSVGLWRWIRVIDASATVPQVEIGLLRSISMFTSLPPPEVEALARRLEPLRAGPGVVVMREGEPGDQYYAVADGTLSVTRSGRTLAVLARGDGFGEIALVHDVPRTATVTSRSPVLLYRLGKEPFVLAMTGHPAAGAEARAVSERRLRAHRDGARPEHRAGDGSGGSEPGIEESGAGADR